MRGTVKSRWILGSRSQKPVSKQRVKSLAEYVSGQIREGEVAMSGIRMLSVKLSALIGQSFWQTNGI